MAISIELFIINTLILKVTVPDPKETNFIRFNAFNICYIIYQGAQLLSMISSRVFLMNNLELIPGLQIVLLILMAFISFQSNCLFNSRFPVFSGDLLHHFVFQRISGRIGLCYFICPSLQKHQYSKQ